MATPGSWIKNEEDKKQKTRPYVLKPHLTHRPMKGNPELRALLTSMEEN